MAKMLYKFSIFFCAKEDITIEYYFGDFEVIVSSECNAISRAAFICSGLMLVNTDCVYYYKMVSKSDFSKC